MSEYRYCSSQTLSLYQSRKYKLKAWSKLKLNSMASFYSQLHFIALQDYLTYFSRWANKVGVGVKACFQEKPPDLLSLVVLVKMNWLIRLWHLSPSVTSIFKHACAAIYWGNTSDIWPDHSSTFILHVCEQRRLWRDCADAQSCLSLRCLPMR